MFHGKNNRDQTKIQKTNQKSKRVSPLRGTLRARFLSLLNKLISPFQNGLETTLFVDLDRYHEDKLLSSNVGELLRHNRCVKDTIPTVLRSWERRT